MKVKLLFSLLGLCASSGLELYVSPTGDDGNSGAADAPLASLEAARAKAQAVAGKEAVTVTVKNGVYYLPETLKFSPADSGSEKFPVVYQAENEQEAVISGGSLLSLEWSEYKDGIYQATTPAGLNVDQLFIDGESQRMARYPNYDASLKAKPYQGYSADAFAPERVANWADPKGGYIHAMHVAGWGGYHYLITGKDEKNKVIYEGGWQNNRKMGMHKDHRMVENIFEELDAPGEWYHNAAENVLYYKPTDGVDLKTAKVEVVRLKHLIEFQGSEESPVEHITLKGFVVRHAARTFMATKEQLLRSDWAIYRGGAVFLTGTKNISILDSEFDQLGGNAIFVSNFNRGTLVKGCHIHHTGASGVCFVGDPDAVRDPLFEYGEMNDLSKISLEKGPKTNNYPMNCAVEDCLINKIGTVERQPAGVQISMAAKIEVRDCSIYDCARAGINVSEGTWGGHLIERCDVFDTVLETHDHGSFNSWGRDRYWRKDHLTTVQEAVDANPELPFLDAIYTTVIRDSRWRCDHGWDIDLDDGSTNYDIYNNLMLNQGLKLREGFRRKAWNNVSPHGRLHPHVWFQGSKDEVYSNIFCFSHAYARMAEPYTRDGTMVDKNLFTLEQNALERGAIAGWDANSKLGDPLFVDPAAGDFRVKEGSPALELGFKNFDMTNYGVKKPRLKAIARTPNLARGLSKKDKQRTFSAWYGAKLCDLIGEEFSAYGVSKDAAGMLVKAVVKGSVLEAAGLKKGDLIQGINGSSTYSPEAFNKAIKAKADTYKLQVIRNQVPLELNVAAQ